MRPFTCRELSQREVKAKERRGPRRASSLFKVSALRGSGREDKKGLMEKLSRESEEWGCSYYKT